MLQTAQDRMDRCAVENDSVGYRKSTVSKDGILKTACAFTNNSMNREIGLILIGTEEEDDEATGRKAVPVRPVSGTDEANMETTEKGIRSLPGHVHKKPVYLLIRDKMDDCFSVILAVEPEEQRFHGDTLYLQRHRSFSGFSRYATDHSAESLYWYPLSTAS